MQKDTRCVDGFDPYSYGQTKWYFFNTTSQPILYEEKTVLPWWPLNVVEKIREKGKRRCRKERSGRERWAGGIIKAEVSRAAELWAQASQTDKLNWLCFCVWMSEAFTHHHRHFEQIHPIHHPWPANQPSHSFHTQTHTHTIHSLTAPSTSTQSSLITPAVQLDPLSTYQHDSLLIHKIQSWPIASTLHWSSCSRGTPTITPLTGI